MEISFQQKFVVMPHIFYEIRDNFCAFIRDFNAWSNTIFVREY